MKEKFYTAYEYGMGSIVQIIFARSAQEITSKYPKLTVFHPTSEWIGRHRETQMREYDIDDPPDEIMARFTGLDEGV